MYIQTQQKKDTPTPHQTSERKSDTWADPSSTRKEHHHAHGNKHKKVTFNYLHKPTNTTHQHTKTYKNTFQYTQTDANIHKQSQTHKPSKPTTSGMRIRIFQPSNSVRATFPFRCFSIKTTTNTNQTTRTKTLS